MKPAWDALMTDYEDSATALVADVDCTAGGEGLCTQIGVRGYPTIKWGDPQDLQDYEGGRTEADLKKFAEENLKPQCGPNSLDACTPEKKAQLDSYMKMDPDELALKIEELQNKVTDADERFQKEVAAAEKAKRKAEKAKDKAIKKVKDGGLSAMRSALAFKEKTGKTEL